MAVRSIEKCKEDGSYVEEVVPDVQRRQWGAERAMELFGDRVTKIEQTVSRPIDEHDAEMLKRLEGGLDLSTYKPSLRSDAPPSGGFAQGSAEK